jgi:hypothetical protein
MPRACGFEISPTSFRAVVVDGSPKAWRVVSWAEGDVPAPAEGQDPKEAFAQAVTKFVQDRRLPRGNLIPSLPSSLATLREVTLPFGSDDQLRKTVKFELESHTHSFDVDQVVVDFVKVDQKERQTFILAFAVPKKELRARLDQLAAARVDPPAMDLDATAVLNAILNSPDVDLAKPFVAFHTGRAGSCLFHYSGGLKLARVLPLSSAEEGFEAKASAEIGRTLLRVSGGADLSEVLVTGDADDLPGLAARVARDSGVPAKAASLFPADLEVEGAEAAKRVGGAALGLALKGIGLDRVGLDLRREEFTYERKTDQLKKAAAVFLLMLNVFFGLWAYKEWDDRKFHQSRHDEVLGLEAKLWSDLFQGEKAPSKPLEAFRSRKADWQESQGGGGHPIPTSALSYWAMLFQRIKVENKFYIDNLTVSATPGSSQIKLSGKADPAPEVERIWQAIKAEKAFANARPPATGQDKGMWKYDIDIPIASGEPGK